MKFAHEFKEALAREGFPAHWVETAVPYGQLKKCIKKVETELRTLGLDSSTLAQLMPAPSQHDGFPSPISRETAHRNSDQSSSLLGSVAFQYDFDGRLSNFRPKLTLFIRLEDGLAVDAALTPATRYYLKKLAQSQEGASSVTNISRDSTHLHSNDDARDIIPPLVENPLSESEESHTASTAQSDSTIPGIQRVEVPLIFDAEFFGLLQGDVTNLDALQLGEQKAMTDQILKLSHEVTTLTKPSKFAKSDLYRWRELFDLYTQAGIFFSTHENDHGTRSSGVALKQLQWFQNEVVRAGIVESFKLPASRHALERFVSINIALLRNLRFQEINQVAIRKILKKFDKRTQLGATKTFPKLIQSDTIMTETMAKAVCAQVSEDIIKLVPQVDDYLCPICFTISWRPIRLKCKHILCIRCTIRMQKERKLFCPLCRDRVIMEADEDNIDEELASFIKKYFPKETRQKQIELETAAGVEQFGIYYKHPSESKCLIM